MNDATDDEPADATAQGTDDEGEPPVSERYGAIEMDNGDVVVYDQERSSAWLQSDLAVPVDA
mgnify:CR=1 FL=1